MLVIISLSSIILFVIIPDLVNIYNNYKKSEFIANAQTLYKNVSSYACNSENNNEIFLSDKSCNESNKIFNAGIDYYIIVENEKIFNAGIDYYIIVENEKISFFYAST